MRVLIFILLFAASECALAQSKTEPAEQPVKAGYGEAVVQKQPEFPGGPDSLRAFIKRTIHYPRQSATDGIRGKVWLSFTVDYTGAIRDSSVLKHVNEEIDAEALRVLSVMPLWIPGTMNGSPANTPYILQMEFVPPGQKP